MKVLYVSIHDQSEAAGYIYIQDSGQRLGKTMLSKILSCFVKQVIFSKKFCQFFESKLNQWVKKKPNSGRND